MKLFLKYLGHLISTEVVGYLLLPFLIAAWLLLFPFMTLFVSFGKWQKQQVIEAQWAKELAAQEQKE